MSTKGSLKILRGRWGRRRVVIRTVGGGGVVVGGGVALVGGGVALVSGGSG